MKLFAQTVLSGLLSGFRGSPWRGAAFLAGFLGLAGLPSATAAEKGTEGWSQWRGPQRDGTTDGKKWPANFAGLNPLWEVQLGPSYSGPVFSPTLVFTTESVDKRLERVVAVNRKSGKVAWTAEWEGYQSVPFFAKKNGDWIRSTPAYDGKDLFVAGMQDLLVSLDAASGKINWKLDFAQEFQSPAPGFGCVSSPMVQGGAVYVQAGAGFCKVDKTTGKVLWRTLENKGDATDSAFSSPVFAQVGDQSQILVQTREALCGVDPGSGKVLWQQPIKAFRGMNIQTPVVRGSRLFTSAYQGSSQAWDLAGSRDAWKVKLAWEHKSEGYMSSPVLVDGKLYLHLRNQRFTCLDLESGQPHWVTDQKFGNYWSLIAQNKRLLALDQNGTLHLIQANPAAFELIASRKISDAETWAHLAVENDFLVVRALDQLLAFRWTSAPASAD